MLKKLSPLLALLAPLLLLPALAFGQQVNVYPTEQFIPVGGYQTVTAIVSGENDTTVTWTSDGGTIFGTNPCTSHEPCSAALNYNTNSGFVTTGPGICATVGCVTYHLTATSNADHTKTATATIHFMPSPTKVTDHPRFIYNSSNISTLTAKATAGNKPYQAMLSYFKSIYDGSYKGAWGGGTGFSCNGGTGVPSSLPQGTASNQFEWYFAMLAEMDPGDASYKWGCMDRDLTTAVADDIITNGASQYGGNPWSDSSDGFAFGADWELGQNLLNTGTGATATATITGGVLNTPTLTAGGSGYLPGTTIHWYAFQGTSGCTVIENSDVVASGTVNVNSSGVVAGTMTTTKNATGCASAPAIVIYNDKQLVRQSMYYWLQFVTLNASGNGTTGTLCSAANYPACYNSSGQWTSFGSLEYIQLRAVGNNYTHARDLYLVAFSLTFNDDTTDDPPLANTCSASRYQVCPDGTAGSLHAYWNFYDGTLSYLEFASLENGELARQIYQSYYSNVPTTPMCNTPFGVTLPCFGTNRGGEGVEGRFYSANQFRTQLAYMGAFTAGWVDPLLYGPQMSLLTTDYNDLRALADTQAMVTIVPSYGPAADEGRYTTWYTGDSNHFGLYPSDFGPEAVDTIWNNIVGRTDMENAYLWPVYYSSPGGPSGTTYPCASYCGWNAVSVNDLGRVTVPFLVMSQPAWDPLANLPADPRPSEPVGFYDAGTQHLVVRSGWSSSDTEFSYYLPNTLVDHEHQFAGRFDIMSNGEAITKGRTVFDDYNTTMTQSSFENMVSIVNAYGIANTPTCSDYNCTWWNTFDNGGPMWHQLQQGIQTPLYSTAADHAAMVADTTVNYNTGSASSYPNYTDITGAYRSILYLPTLKEVVWFDRNTVKQAADYQTENLITTGAPTVSGNVASWLTRSASQKVWYQSLDGGTVTGNKLPVYTKLTGPYGNLQNGTSMQLTCTRYMADGSTQDCTSTATYVVSTAYAPGPTGSVTVSSTGLVTGTGLGLVCIRSMDVGGPIGSFTSTLAGNHCSGSDATQWVQVVSTASSGSFDSNVYDDSNLEDFEPDYNLVTTPSGTPTSSRFLNVMKWGTSTLAQPANTLVNSSSGNAFEGSLLDGTTLVLFMQAIPTGRTFTSVTYPASGATAHYVVDLAPNTSYTITGAGAPSTATSDSAGVLSFAATGTGNITVGAYIPPSIASMSGGIFSGGVMH